MIDTDKFREMVCAGVNETDETEEVMRQIIHTAEGVDARQYLSNGALRNLVAEIIENYKNLLFQRADVPAPATKDDLAALNSGLEKS